MQVQEASGAADLVIICKNAPAGIECSIPVLKNFKALLNSGKSTPFPRNARSKNFCNNPSRNEFLKPLSKPRSSCSNRPRSFLKAYVCHLEKKVPEKKIETQILSRKISDLIEPSQKQRFVQDSASRETPDSSKDKKFQEPC
jgi:hypothetical protein